MRNETLKIEKEREITYRVDTIGEQLVALVDESDIDDYVKVMFENPVLVGITYENDKKIRVYRKDDLYFAIAESSGHYIVPIKNDEIKAYAADIKKVNNHNGKVFAKEKLIVFAEDVEVAKVKIEKRLKHEEDYYEFWDQNILEVPEFKRYGNAEEIRLPISD